MTNRLFPTLLMLAAVIAGGTIGYVGIEGWSVWDAFYMTVTTVATVGYREVHPLTRAGQAFTLALILVGVSAALYAFSVLAAMVVEGGWPKYVERWRYARMISTFPITMSSADTVASDRLSRPSSRGRRRRS